MKQAASSRLTRNQQAVLRTLQASGKALGAYQILGELQEDGLSAPPQVYRALDRLCRDGLVHRIESLNAFVACGGHRHDDDVGFAICERCASVSELPLDAIEAEMRSKTDRFGFEIHRTRVELTGLCAECIAAEGAAAE
jgi:Fur family zinc uptake transcriptional regulator